MSDFFFGLEHSFWTERRRPNLLLVHYNDLKADLPGEMKRIAKFLDITPPAALWPLLVEAATFEAMKRDGGTLMAQLKHLLVDGHENFFYKGTNSRWRGILTDADLALYDRKIAAQLSPSLIRWLAEGRLVVGDPKISRLDSRYRVPTANLFHSRPSFDIADAVDSIFHASQLS